MSWILAFLLMSISGPLSAKTVNYVFKGGVARPFGKTDKAAPRTMTFGLSPRQMSEIYQLSQGTIDFSNVYYIQGDEALAFEMQGRDGFHGVHSPDVPPPMIFTPLNMAESTTLADPELQNEWWFNKLGVMKAWELASGDGVTIADCDSGFYLNEIDLHENVLPDFRYDFANSDEPLNVEDGPFASHGTAVASIMLGVRNAAGSNGIAYRSKLVPLQNFNYDSGKDKLDKEEATARCVLQAIKTPGVQIIVLENQTQMGSSETFSGTRNAVRLAVQSGIVVVSAAGNSGLPLLEEEKDDTGSILVGAVDRNDLPENFSNFGSRLTVSAYGEGVRTLYGPNGVLGYFGGTSAATPQVAATVALMIEVQPLLTPKQAQEILRATRSISDSNRIVAGVLNTHAAVQAAKESRPQIETHSVNSIFRQRVTAILNQ